MERTDFNNQRVLVMGLGKTGQAAARYFYRRGAQVTVSDHGDTASLQTLGASLRAEGLRVELGAHRPASFMEAQLIILSPGVPHELPILQAARAQGIPVVGEIEFAAACLTSPIIAITGSNGKTTTTALTGTLLQHAGYDVFVGGNIGNPLIGFLDREESAEVLVLELSSFQLDTVEHFCPSISILLNIQPDHLDRYADFEAYGRAKARIFKNQTAAHCAILNAADPEVRKWIPQLQARTFLYAPEEFTGLTYPPAGIISRNAIRISLPERNGGKPVDFDLSGVKLPGAHNRENICAALLAALLHGAEVNSLQRALEAFTGLSHRLEEVRILQQVRYVNDSKATNVAALRVALAAFEAPLVLIMGGRPKGDDFAELKPGMNGRVRHLIVMGEAAQAIQTALAASAPVSRVNSMQEAVGQARRVATPGDVVLLSPACASFDMFDNYNDRGEAFRRAVQELA